MGKKRRQGHFTRLTVIDEEMIRFIARQMARKYGLRRAAVALLHAANLRQRKIGEILDMDQSTVSRRLKGFFAVYERVRSREE